MRGGPAQSYRLFKWIENSWVHRKTKVALAILGRFFPRFLLFAADSAFSFVVVGNWVHRNKGAPFLYVDSRADIFRQFAERMDRASHPVYLEFGVHEGATIAQLAQLSKNPRSKFFGFDSFEGLPEAWNDLYPRGHFSLDGKMPIAIDSRLQFVKGWFDLVLPQWSPPAHDQLIVSIDCDLYSSSRVVLKWIDDHLQPGDLLYFDEFYDRNNEFRAFVEYQSSSRHDFKILWATQDHSHLCFEVIQSRFRESPLDGSSAD